jgi:drug/metabolite transporter (DMT)-like permease
MKIDKNLVFIHLAVVLFGFAGLFGKWILLSPLVIVFGRVLFASLTLFIYGYKNKSIIFPKNWFNFLVLGALLAIHWVSFFASIQMSSVAIGLLSFSSFPIFTNFLEPYFLKSPIEKRNILLSILTLIGVYWIVPHFSITNHIFLGVFWGLISGLTFSLLAIWNKKMVTHLNPLSIALFQDLSAGIFLFPLVLYLSPQVSSFQIFQLLILGVLFTALAHTLFIYGLKSISAGKASLIASLEPIYGIIGGIFLLGEIPETNTIVGGILILIGVIFSKK